MAVKKLSDNVKIDVAEKTIFVNMSAMTEEDKQLVEWNKGEDFIVVPMRSRKGTKKAVKLPAKQTRNKAWYLKQLEDDAEGLKEFEKLCKAKGFFAARAWYDKNK